MDLWQFSDDSMNIGRCTYYSVLTITGSSEYLGLIVVIQ